MKLSAFTRIEQNADQNVATAFKRYRKCLLKKGETCDAAIMKHFLDHVKADEKLIKEEGHGEFGKMLEGIPTSHVER